MKIVSTNTFCLSLVNEPMLDQIDSQREAFDATFALERLLFLLHSFSQMTFHVLVQHSEHSKAFLATLTLERFHSCMCSFKVILQVVWLGKELFTLWAWERGLRIVQFPVLLKIAKIDKFLVTHLTHEISYTIRVDFSMLLQSLSSFESNLTNITNVWHLLAVGYHMRLQTPQVFELGLAVAAPIEFLTGMTSHVQFKVIWP